MLKVICYTHRTRHRDDQLASKSFSVCVNATVFVLWFRIKIALQGTEF